MISWLYIFNLTDDQIQDFEDQIDSPNPEVSEDELQNLPGPTVPPKRQQSNNLRAHQYEKIVYLLNSKLPHIDIKVSKSRGVCEWPS